MGQKSQEAQEFTKYYQQKKVTSTYDSQREGTAYRRKKREIELKHFIELIDKKNNEKVLELGCSSGFLTKELGKVTAIDTSEGMLKIAGSKNKKATCVYGDMFEIPFNKNNFDKVVTMRVWNHFDENDLRRAIKESKRVLKKEGKLIFDTEDKSNMRRLAGFFYKKIFRPTGFKIYQYSLDRINKILKEEGFMIEKTRFLKHRIGRQIILSAKLIDKN